MKYIEIDWMKGGEKEEDKGDRKKNQISEKEGPKESEDIAGSLQSKSYKRSTFCYLEENKDGLLGSSHMGMPCGVCVEIRLTERQTFVVVYLSTCIMRCFYDRLVGTFNFTFEVSVSWGNEQKEREGNTKSEDPLGRLRGRVVSKRFLSACSNKRCTRIIGWLWIVLKLMSRKKNESLAICWSFVLDYSYMTVLAFATLISEINIWYWVRHLMEHRVTIWRLNRWVIGAGGMGID